MKKSILSFAVILISCSLLRATDVPAGDVSGTWTRSGSPYNILGDIGIPYNQVLTIEPGVEVIFQGPYRLNVYQGDLIAVGTPGEMILFTMADTSGLVAGGEDEGGWNGIYFSYSSESGDTCRLEYCRFEYSKVIDNVSGGRGTICTERIPRLLVANCVFEYNYSKVSGVDCRLADVAIRNNIFRNNVGQNLFQTSQANPTIIGNRIEQNTFKRLMEVNGWCFPVLENNIIKDNQVANILYAYGEKANPTLVNNMIIDNRITAGQPTIYLNTSDAKLYGNLIANNDGGGIAVYGGNSQLLENTIVNNSGYNPLRIATNQGLFSGNIIYGNSMAIYYSKLTTEPTIIYNLIEGGTGSFIGTPFTGPQHDNLDAPPQFIDGTMGAGPAYDAEAADFGLLSTSPAINKGDPGLNEENFLPIDVYGNERVKYSFIDIGASEGSVSNMSIGPVTYSSDETLIADTIKVYGNITIDDNVVLRIAGGSRIIFQGPYLIDVNGTLLAEGSTSDPITFTVSDTTGFGGADYNAGCWKGIWLIDDGSIDDNLPSSFSHCIFEFAKTNANGGVFSLSSIEQFSLSYCTFQYNRGATGRSVIEAMNSKLHMDHCSILHNYSVDQSYAEGSIYLYNTDLDLSNSIFAYNRASNGICLDMYNGILHSTSNLFHNNSTFTWAGGGTVLNANNSECTILNDLAVNNTSSNEGVYNFSSCFARIINSTIVNNRTSNSNFAGGIGLTRTELTITNSILCGNTAGSQHYSIFLFEENTDPDLYNCLVEGGAAGIRTYQGFSFTGAFVDCLDKAPHFIQPTTLSGMDEDAEGSNWQLLDISPAINGGKADTSGLQLPATDLGGNPRVLYGRVDIGAYEKAGHAPVITIDPQGGNFCTDDDILLQVGYGNTDTVLVKWKKDGVAIPGATDLSLVISPAELSDEGNYVCVLSNTYGTVNSVPVFLSVKAPPEILVEPDYSWVRPDVMLNMDVQVNGSSPLVYQWKKDGQIIPGAILPEYKFLPADSSYEGSYTCTITNVCGEAVTTPVNLLLAPQICMVTVDPATGRNLVVWEKKTHASLLAYNIYRETQAAGIYDILGTVPFDALSEFTDSTADPTVQAYLYKITALDESGVETDADLCKPHKTIHLLVSTNPELNTTQLAWDKYYGFDYQTYYIYRSTDRLSFDLVHSMASSSNSWTDPSPVEGDLYYRVAVQRPVACTPVGGKKAGTGPYTHALSNLDDNKLKAGESPPDSIVMDNQSIDENGIPGLLVGRFTTFDPDSGDHHTYELVNGTGDDDNSSFLVIGDMLLSGITFDYETKNSYSVRVSSTDMASNEIERAFTITINDTGEPGSGQGTGENPPTALTLDNSTIDENSLPGTLVGRLETSDPDTFDVHTYQLVSGTGGGDNGSFTIYGDLLIAAASFDYETRNTYSVRVRSTDLASNHIEASFTITVNDLEEGGGSQGTGAAPPDTVMLSRMDITENNVVGALVARLITVDPDTFDVHTYQLVTGSGDDDNESFAILGDMLLAAKVFDYEEKNTYTLRVRSTDLAGNHLENTFIIQILDVDETVGISVNEGQVVRIYPNPFTHSARVEFPNPGGEAYAMRVIDLTGKVVQSREGIRTSQFELLREDLGKGYYIIELRGKEVYRGRIVIE